MGRGTTGKTITAAADEVGVPRTTVQQWVRLKKIEANVDGRDVRITAKGMKQLRALAAEREETQADDAETGDLREQLLQAQVRERRAISRLRELELDHESGRFVELAVVQRDAADTRERILAVLRAIPQRTAMALECSCRTAAVVESVLRDEVERAIAELSESNYGGQE